jgi:hypothetical protein
VIFALTDFAQYLLRNGPYSSGPVVAQGAFLATPDKVSQLHGKIHDGDLIACHPLNSFVSWVVMYVTGSLWSHVGILTSECTVLEAITQGSVERPVSCYFDGKHYLLIKPLNSTFTDERRREIVSRGRSRLGIRYGWGQAIRLGLQTICGFHCGWQIRCSIDVVLLLAAFWLVARPFHWLRLVLGILAVGYVAVVFAGNRSRKKMQERMDAANREVEGRTGLPGSN